VYRDGRRVAVGQAEGPEGVTDWIDRAATGDSPTPCYSVEAVDPRTGNVSHRSRAVCWRGVDDGHLQRVSARDFRIDGRPVDPAATSLVVEGGHEVEVPLLRPRRSGDHLLSFAASNRSGPINTGVTCAVRHVSVRELPAGTVVAEGIVFTPHSEASESSFLRVRLDASRTYRVLIGDSSRAINMSDFAHFARYTGGAGGARGPVNRMDVHELRLLWRGGP
jgi:hypothetical protein